MAATGSSLLAGAGIAVGARALILVEGCEEPDGPEFCNVAAGTWAGASDAAGADVAAGACAGAAGSLPVAGSGGASDGDPQATRSKSATIVAYVK